MVMVAEMKKIVLQDMSHWNKITFWWRLQSGHINPPTEIAICIRRFLVRMPERPTTQWATWSHLHVAPSQIYFIVFSTIIVLGFVRILKRVPFLSNIPTYAWSRCSSFADIRFLAPFCSHAVVSGDLTVLINWLKSWFLSVYMYSIFLSNSVSLISIAMSSFFISSC